MSRFNRRSFLQKSIVTGAALQLPFIGRSARGQAAPPLNLFTVFVPDGCIPSLWNPKGGERDFTLPSMSDPLNPVRDEMLFLEGVGMYGGEPTHPGGSKKVLTGTGPQSLDVFLGQKLKNGAPFDSVQLGVASNFENGSGSISFVGIGQEAKPDDNPINAFQRLFEGKVSGPPAPGGGMTMGPDLDLARKQKKSVLDVIKADVTALEAKLSASEKSKLELHLQALRDVESRLAGISMPPTGMPGAPPMACDTAGWNKQGYQNVGTGYPQHYHKAENFATVGQLQTDLAVLALSCSLTHAVTLMWSHAVSPTKIDGGTIGNHDSSHYGTNPANATGQQFIRNRRWFMTKLAELVSRMKQTPYGESNLLDHTIIYLCSDINDGDLHDHRSIPFALAGGARAGLGRGRYLNFTGKGQGGQNETHAKLLVSIARRLGVMIDSFGYTAMGTGPLAGV
jgi:hypothetical protein